MSSQDINLANIDTSDTSAISDHNECSALSDSSDDSSDDYISDDYSDNYVDEDSALRVLDNFGYRAQKWYDYAIDYERCVLEKLIDDNNYQDAAIFLLDRVNIIDDVIIHYVLACEFEKATYFHDTYYKIYPIDFKRIGRNKAVSDSLERIKWYNSRVEKHGISANSIITKRLKYELETAATSFCKNPQTYTAEFSVLVKGLLRNCYGKIFNYIRRATSGVCYNIALPVHIDRYVDTVIKEIFSCIHAQATISMPQIEDLFNYAYDKRRYDQCYCIMNWCIKEGYEDDKRSKNIEEYLSIIRSLPVIDKYQHYWLCNYTFYDYMKKADEIATQKYLLSHQPSIYEIIQNNCACEIKYRLQDISCRFKMHGSYYEFSDSLKLALNIYRFVSAADCVNIAMEGIDYNINVPNNIIDEYVDYIIREIVLYTDHGIQGMINKDPNFGTIHEIFENAYNDNACVLYWCIKKGQKCSSNTSKNVEEYKQLFVEEHKDNMRTYRQFLIDRGVIHPERQYADDRSLLEKLCTIS